MYYHNPRCRKSREGLVYLNENNIHPEIREYLKDLITKEELKSILKKLNIEAHDLLRKNETIYKTNIKGKDLNNEEIITEMVKNPKLIERPILVSEEKAIIGRPKENLLKIKG
tara:strand:+ start:1222 stop:1560 length:339 start_codon:yes stop_codon:yes gene_type:complete